MESNDTVKLLRECNAGSKMAVSAIDEVLEKTQNPRLKRLLNKSKRHHAKLGDRMHTLLAHHSAQDKDPGPMAKGMSWMKTNWKMGMDESDATVADLITDGCNMGVKSLNRYLNRYQAADKKARDICRKLIHIEESLCRDLKGHL
jgi:uncharacterized protein YaaN involved in tellurite resistance